MEQPECRTIYRGQNGPYHWLTASGDVYMGTLLKACPEAVLVRYLAVTSYDSGIRHLTPEESASGWTLENEIAYSPKVSSIETLAYQRDGLDCPGYDEWYVFPEPRKLNPIFRDNFFEFQRESSMILVFVNLAAFILHEPEPGIVDRFWTQVETIAPETYIADGRDYLTVVSRSEPLITTIAHRLTAA